ncbi:MAG: hypothetical protein KJP00_10235 [Bacteroidia bacterium]|nr:hypothetical protein [Bacteroidia bacterium]
MLYAVNINILTLIRKLETTTKTSFNTTPLLADYSYITADRIDQISDLWKSLQPKHNIFLQCPYLKLAEDYPSEGSLFLYFIIFKADEPHGIIYFQQGLFKASDSVNTDSNFRSKQDSFARRAQARLARSIQVDTLVLGNILLTGENAFHFPNCNEDECDCRKLKVIDAAINVACKEFKKKGKDIRFLFLKDYYPDSAYAADECKSRGYFRTAFEPSMELDLGADWKTYEDYLAAVRSKYRVKFKKVNKKLEPLERKDLSLEEIIDHQEELYNFYLAIRNKAGFNLVQLHPQYFEACKRTYGDDFKVFGLFEGDKMIAFHSFFVLEEDLDAHWLGYTDSKNKQYELYFNMLLLAIRLGIELGKKRILFARTAMEIKSSVGAEPHQMYVYLKHRNKFLNSAIPKIATFLKGNEDWVQRKPFKE